MLASLAAGLVVTLASGELRADRDVELELLRANEALDERLAQQEVELLELRRAVEAAGKPGANNPGTTQPGSAPKSKQEADVEELAAFRKKVLGAVKPELDAIDAKAETAKEAFDKHVVAYAKHRHDYEVASHGWVKIDTMLTTEGVEMLRPTYADDWLAIRRDNAGGSLAKTTTKPK